MDKIKPEREREREREGGGEGDAYAEQGRDKIHLNVEEVSKGFIAVSLRDSDGLPYLIEVLHQYWL